MSKSGSSLVGYRSNWTLALLIVVGISSLLFAYAAFDQSMLLRLSEQHRAGWLSLLTIFEWRGVNWAVVALVLAVLFEGRKLVRQLQDNAALRILDDRIHFHRSIGQSPVFLGDVADASYTAGAVRSDLIVRLKSDRTIRIRNVDDCDAQGFVAMMEKQLAGPNEALVSASQSD